MSKILLHTLLVGTTLMFSQAALAEGDRPKSDSRWAEIKDKSPEERKEMRGDMREKMGDMREKWASMSDEEKAKFKEERKAKWHSLSKDEKIKLINEKHDEMKKRMEEKWNSMSDDEKIKFAEERMKSHAGGGGRSPRGDGARPVRE